MSWFEQYGSTAIFFSIGSALTVIGIAEFFCSWWIPKQVQKHVREKREISAIRDKDVGDVLAYLTTDSVWAWRRFARQSGWAAAADEHAALSEIRAAALRDDISTFGNSPGETKTVFLGRRIWEDRRLERRGGFPLIALPGRPVPFYERIGIAEVDIERAWPRASWPRRAVTLAWVRIKAVWSFLRHIPERLRRR